MFCPQCGQKQLSNEVRFCSACGFQLNVVTQLLATGGNMPWRGASPPGPRKLSPRQKGIRQGAMLMMSTLVVVPIVIFLGVALLDLPGELIPLAGVVCVMGGLLRILYAVLMEDGQPQAEQDALPPSYAPPQPQTFMGPNARGAALPPPQGAPASGYRPPMRANTGELTPRPPSVTENTTRLLNNQPEDPGER